MANNDIIQVPPNFIVERYNAVKKVVKQLPVTAGVSVVLEAGIDYDYGTTDLGQPNYNPTAAHWDANGVMTQDVFIPFKVQTLKDLHDASLPLTLLLPDFDYGVGTTLHIHNIAFIDAVDATTNGIQLTINDSPFLALLAANTIDLVLSFTRQPTITYSFKVTKPFYPFAYETKYIGLGDAVEYISPTNPTWIDIDINSMFMNPRNIPCSAGEKLYLLHKNKL